MPATRMYRWVVLTAETGAVEVVAAKLIVTPSGELLALDSCSVPVQAFRAWLRIARKEPLDG